MNLQPLFETQDQLDAHIIEEKGLQGQDLLDKKILALQVELGELANEWRGFKFWSEDQEPNRGKEIAVECDFCEGAGRNFMTGDYCPECDGSGMDGEYAETEDCLLEEYVDNFHFILSIGLELGIKKYKVRAHKQQTIVDQFIELNYQTYLVLQQNEQNKGANKGQWYLLLDMFVGLGEMLGFTWEEIEQAYYEKNEINHARQQNGY